MASNPVESCGDDSFLDRGRHQQPDSFREPAPVPAPVTAPSAEQRQLRKNLGERSRQNIAAKHERDRQISKARSRSPPVRSVSPPPRPNRAQAIFYDDNRGNFAGVSTRGKVPSIRTVHCTEPLSIPQIEEALALASAEDVEENAPTLLFFFDFDLTLSLRDGLQAEGVPESLGELFGSEERQQRLRVLLSSLMQQKRCYILTANSGYVTITSVLNELISGPAGHVGAWFKADETVRFVHHRDLGGKVKVLQHIVQGRGLNLVTLY